jgi:membrane protease YdiL (CAAX protease family)
MLVHPVLRRSPRLLRRPVAGLLLVGSAGVGFLLFLLLDIPGMAYVEFRPLGATLWLLALVAAFLRAFARPRGRRAAVRRRQNRLRTLGPALPWLLAAIPLEVLATTALALLSVRGAGGVLVDPTSAVARYADRSLAWLPMMLFGCAFAPLVEEFGFRGWTQRPLERALGAPAAIVLTAAVFGALHQGPAPNRVLGGIVYGSAVVLTGSIWAGVLLHAGSNALSQLLAALLPDDPSSPAEAVHRLTTAIGDPILHGTPVACSLLLLLIGVKLRRLRRSRGPASG